MNAAFLLVTGAMLVGQAGDKKPAPPPAAPAPVSSCGSCDSCGCETWGHKLRDRLQGLFNRDCCDSCQPTTCHDHCRTKLWQPACHEPKCCAPAPTCCAPAPSCCADSCCGHKFLDKLRERFSRKDCCCDGGCGAVTTTPPPEKVAPPAKKMPKEAVPMPKKTNTDVRIDTPSAPIAAPAVIEPLPTPPAVEVTPVPVPRVEGAPRDPF